MIPLIRNNHNPVLNPDISTDWYATGAFNGCVIKNETNFQMLFRALSKSTNYRNINMPLSTIGIAESKDGINFDRGIKQFIVPEQNWELFGCEDPRITYLENKYFIFYTALSSVPFNAGSIKVGLAISEDLIKINEKHLVTPFNAKAMALFPKKIRNKFVAFVTANTDMPPSKIALAYFDKQEDIWSQNYWIDWYKNLDNHTLHLQRTKNDHVEAGAPPIYTENGWLLIYSYIKDYFTSKRKFYIDCVLLDLENPNKIIGRVEDFMLLPQAHYELYGNVPNIVFPTGALLEKDELYVYYGAADTTTCLATIKTKELFSRIKRFNTAFVSLTRAQDNPILKPKSDHYWEAKAVFNPAAFYEDKKVHIIYRAMSPDGTSTMGYANSTDAIHIDDRLFEPIYIPHEGFEHKKRPGNSGCEDPRVTKIDDKLYMCYTAFDSESPPRVALTSIDLNDFLKHRWAWEPPKLISPPGIDDKDAAILPEKVKGKYVIFHRIVPDITIDFVDSLDFDGKTWLKSEAYISPGNEYWDNSKIGICAPPIKTDKGWLMLYHSVSNLDNKYRVGAMLLKHDDPSKVIARSMTPILSPSENFEIEGQTKNVVFPCGTIMLNNYLYVYYGGGDSVVAVASIKLEDLLNNLV